MKLIENEEIMRETTKNNYGKTVNVSNRNMLFCVVCQIFKTFGLKVLKKGSFPPFNGGSSPYICTREKRNHTQFILNKRLLVH